MKMRHFALVLGMSAAAWACQSDEQHGPTAVTVSANAETVTTRTSVDEARHDRMPIEVSEATIETAQGAESGKDPVWLPRLQRVCKDLAEPSDRTTRNTDGWDAWKSKVDLSVRDLHVFSPQFKTWSLAKVDDATKLSKVKHKGPYYGFGLTVELENKSDSVLDGDNIYVWATFKSKGGERVCFSDASAQRSWNPFAKKGKGAWIKEKDYSEWPLRPSERKRYTITRTSCMTALFTETDVESVKIEVYARFRPLGNDVVIAGPLATFERSGEMLRGVPVAAASATQRIFRGTKKAPIPVQALYKAGDHVLVLEDKKARWVPEAVLMGTGPNKPLKSEPLPAATPAFDKSWGQLTMKVDNWRVDGWRKFDGKLKQGHKLISADVEISVDTSSVTSTLEAAVTTAQTAVTDATAELTAKEAGVTAADAGATAVAGTEGEATAKDAVKAAKAAAKGAKAILKGAAKNLKNAQKAMGGGVSKFLKEQAKAVNCGSFKLEVGRAQLKPFKGSMGKKECKAILGGETVKGTVSFDAARWDMPFALTWQGTGKSVQSYRIASKAVGAIPKD
ncbi:MAG: hypothetical protein ACI9OJ_000099 [Myxococcota bacterium]|jgi:hypothetical protein